MPDNAPVFNNVQKDSLPDQPNTSFSPKYFFVELTSLDELVLPSLVTKRIKFTCIASSSRFIVLGTASGTGYVFSRYRQKNRLTSAGSSMSPIEMFVTKDGPIFCLEMSPSEQMVAVGSDSGRVSVTSLNNQNPSMIYTVPGNSQKPDKVTCLLWSLDSKVLYSGHASGTINKHKLTVRSVFRSSHEVLCCFDGAVTQLNILGSLLLASTTVSSHVYDLEQSTSSTIGTKPRNSHMGACFVKTGVETTCDVKQSTNCEYILAARPNGKIWESNTAGVVYRTHQFRQSQRVVRSHIVTFREPFRGDQSRDEDSLESATNMDVNLQNLHTINVNGTTLVITWFSSYVLLLELDSSHIVMTNLGAEIVDLSICGSDIFILLTGKTALRKVSVLCPKSAISKLEQRQCYAQCGQVILRTSCDILWDTSIILRVADALNTTNSGMRKRQIENEKVRIALYELLESQHNVSQSQYDNVGSSAGDESAAVEKKIGIFSPAESDQDIADSRQSNVEDELCASHTSPLREKSRSSPCVESTSFFELSSTYTSMPVTNNELIGCSLNGAVDVTREDIVTRAKAILENNGQLVDNDSLRFLLQLECVTEDVKFVPTVTVNNVAHSLAQIAMTSPINLPAVFNSKPKPIISNRRRPAIIKPVRPTTKRVAVHIPLAKLEANSNIEIDEISLPAVHPELSEVPIESLNNQENSLERNILEADWLDRRLRVISDPAVSECHISPPISSESGSNTSLMIDEAKEVVESRTNCVQCSLHRSWLTASLLSAVCKRINVQELICSKGGVPSNASQWTSLFEKKRKRLDSDKIHLRTNLCPRCEAGLAVAAKSGDLPTKTGLARDDLRWNTTSIQERMAAADPEKIRSALFGKRINNECRTQKSPVLMPRPEEEVALARTCYNESNSSWISLDIFILLQVCSIVLGYRSTIALVKKTRFYEILSASDWSAMISLALREESIRRNVIGQKVIKDVLESIDMLSMLNVESVSAVSQRSNYSHKTSATLIFSWIIDSSGICPICSTCLSGQSLSTLQVTTFSCGHSYHSTCQDKRTYCIACRVKARKNVIAKRNG